MLGGSSWTITGSGPQRPGPAGGYRPVDAAEGAQPAFAGRLYAARQFVRSNRNRVERNARGLILALLALQRADGVDQRPARLQPTQQNNPP